MSAKASHPTKSHLAFFFSTLIPLCILAAVSLYLKIDPAEDAHIMFRYAVNFAHGHGFVWNIGEAPVEGATEFLWTIILAGGVTAGFDVGIFAQVTALIFSALTIVVMIYSMRSLFAVRIILASLIAIIFAVSPVVVQALSGFGTPLFTFLLTSSWIGLVMMFSEESSQQKIGGWITSTSLLFLGLTRPEGVFFALLILLSVLLLGSKEQKRKFIQKMFWLYIIPGAVYFIWRWNYFGWFLPNTFYAKHGSEFIHLSGFEPIMRLCWISLPIFMMLVLHLLYTNHHERKRTVIFMLPAIIFPWFYLLIEQMQNIGQRFQFPVFPILLIVFGLYSKTLLDHDRIFDRKELLLIFGFIYVTGIIIWMAPILGGQLFRLTAVSASIVVSIFLVIFFGYKNILPRTFSIRRRNFQSFFLYAACLLFAQHVFHVTTHNASFQYDHRVQIGKALKKFSDKRYTMVTTEAGWLPFYSEWKAIDPFGLYDVHIAHYKLDAEYLNLISPALIMFHVYADEYKPVWVPNDPRWNEMTQTLYKYAANHDYVLAAIVGVHHDCYWYYVKKKCPDAKEIIQIVANQEYVQYTKPE